MSKNYPFYNWVPKPVGIILLILLFIPILTVGGVYTANSGEMTSGLGIQSEHIQFVGFVTSIGMAAFAPFFYQLVCIRREKMMCVVGFSLLYILSYVCAVTDSIFLLALCSLIMGFLRMVLMMVNLFTLIKYAFGMEATRNITPGMEPTTEEGWDALDAEKSKSMPIIYLFFMILGQIGTSLTAWLAYEYQWQDVYYYMMGMTLAAILIIMVTMPYHSYNSRRFPINFRKFGSVAVFSAMMTSLCIGLRQDSRLVFRSYNSPFHCACRGVRCSLLLYGIFRTFAVFHDGSVPFAYHQYGFCTLSSADDIQHQFHVCKCLHRSRHED